MIKKIKLLIAGTLLNGLVEIERRRKAKQIRSLCESNKEYYEVQAYVDCGILSILDVKLGIKQPKQKIEIFMKAGALPNDLRDVGVCSICPCFTRKELYNPATNTKNCTRWSYGQCPTPEEAVK